MARCVRPRPTAREAEVLALAWIGRSDRRIRNVSRSAVARKPPKTLGLAGPYSLVFAAIAGLETGEVNGSPLHGAEPDVDVPMVERIATGQVEHREILAWLSKRAAWILKGETT